MNLKLVFKNYGYHFFITFLIIVVGTSQFNLAALFGVPDVLLLVIAFIISLLICIIDGNKKQPLLYVFFISFGFVLTYVMNKSEFNSSRSFKLYHEWLLVERQYQGSENFYYSVLTIVFLGILVGICAYLLQKNMYLRVIIAIVFALVLLSFAFLQIKVTKLFVTSVLTYDFLVLVESIQLRLYKNRKINIEYSMTYLMPLFLCFSFIILIVPTKEQPMEWRLVKSIWRNLSESASEIIANINIWIRPEDADYSVQFAGYSEDGKFGGDIVTSNKEVLQIKVDKKLESGLYLQGNLKNIYTGSEWLEDDHSFKNKYGLSDYQMETLEILYALDRANLDEEIMSAFIDEYIISVQYYDIYTKSLFMHSKTLEIFASRADAFIEKNSNLIFRKLKGVHTNYRVKTLDINMGSYSYINFIKQQERYSYQKNRENIQDASLFFDLLKKYLTVSKEKPQNIESLFYDYSEYINRTYLQLPMTLPLRVTRLAEELTSSLDSDYDKCKAIEGYLLKMTYTTTPKRSKDSKDVVDYLLFESKEGYCTYFATAFAVMARSIGIPTRYVQGFYVNDSDKINYNQYSVNNSGAHAWPEAYINGVGWIPFEPTPSYQEYRYSMWSVPQTAQAQIPSVTPYSTYISDETLQAIEELGSESLSQGKSFGFYYWSVILLSFVIVLISCFSIYVIIRATQCRQRYQKVNQRMRVLADITQILYLLEQADLKRRNEETLSEYFERIQFSTYIQEENKEKVLEVFLRVRYHEEEPVEQLAKEVQIMKNYILEKLKYELGSLRYRLLLIKMLISGPGINSERGVYIKNR